MEKNHQQKTEAANLTDSVGASGKKGKRSAKDQAEHSASNCK